jgi:hypothetical protein
VCVRAVTAGDYDPGVVEGSTLSVIAGLGLRRVAAALLSGALVAVLFVTSASAATRCSTHDLRITEVPSIGGGGSFYLELSYRNVRRSSCTTGGFPGVTLIGSRGQRLSVARRTGGRGVTLTVKPGARVFGFISYSETPKTGRACRAVHAVKVYAPDSTQSSVVVLSDGSKDCQSSAFVYRLQSARRGAR